MGVFSHLRSEGLLAATTLKRGYPIPLRPRPFGSQTVEQMACVARVQPLK
jgi:hypothetical protein